MMDDEGDPMQEGCVLTDCENLSIVKGDRVLFKRNAGFKVEGKVYRVGKEHVLAKIGENIIKHDNEVVVDSVSFGGRVKRMYDMVDFSRQYDAINK